MAVALNIFSYSFLCLSLIYIVLADDQCLKKGPCICEFSNGTGYDLTPSAGSAYFMAQQFKVDNVTTNEFSMNYYYYHPCTDVKMNIQNVAGNCNSSLSICRVKNEIKKVDKSYVYIGGSYENAGSNNETEFISNGSAIIYKIGPSNTIVQLVCAEINDHLEVTSLEDPNAIVLTFYSRNSCLKQLEEIGRSVGSTLLIVFFSVTLLYIVLGVCTKKFLMGATGLEVIPNITFWMDLPNLVKDGWAFALNGFKLPQRNADLATSPDPRSYDSI